MTYFFCSSNLTKYDTIDCKKYHNQETTEKKFQSPWCSILYYFRGHKCVNADWLVYWCAPSPLKGQRAKRQTMVGFESSEKFEDTKGVIKCCRSKYRQYNGQRGKGKKTGWQNTTQETKDWGTQILLNWGERGEHRRFGRVSSSCSTSDTCCVTGLQWLNMVS